MPAQAEKSAQESHPCCVGRGGTASVSKGDDVDFYFGVDGDVIGLVGVALAVVDGDRIVVDLIRDLLPSFLRTMW